MKKLFKVGKLGSAGLSLLELIVSMAILAVISISIGGAMYVSSRSYTRSSAEINVQEEAQVSSNLICDWLVDATSVNPDAANPGKFLDSSDPAVGALPYLEIIHPEGNDEVKIRVELVGDKLTYTATNLNTGAVNSGDLASNVSDVSFYTTFGKDRNVKITMNFNVAGRTYSAVTDSTSRNHDFIAASGSSPVADPVISFPLDEVILEPGQNDDKAGAFSFEGTIINGDNTTMVVSGYSVSGVCTVSCTNVGGTRWKVTCAAEDYYTATPSDCAVTFTATKSLPLFRVRADLDHGQLPVDAVFRFQFLDVPYVYQFGYLLFDLLQDAFISGRHDGNAGKAGIGRHAGRNAFNVVAAS